MYSHPRPAGYLKALLKINCRGRRAGSGQLLLPHWLAAAKLRPNSEITAYLMNFDLDAARALLCSPLVSTLLHIHPNDLAASPAIWPFAEPWDAVGRWTDLLEYYINPNSQECDIPLEIRQVIDQVSALALPRHPIHTTTRVPLGISTRGMSPKKAHEVRELDPLWQSSPRLASRLLKA